jgi:AbrB family looped-hinge helix DNA binding protein
MSIFKTTVTSKGQITLPVEIRNRLRLKPGDRVEIYEDRAGQFFLRPLNASPTAFFESLPARKRSSQVGSDDDAIAKAVSQRDKRSKSTTDAAT